MKLQSQNLTKKYSNKIAVQNLSINLMPGEILGLLGPNGAGKTTFFYMIAGLISSDSGKILIDGEDITNKSVSDRANMGLAYLPQEPSVFGRLSVEENIMAALEQRKDITKEQRQQELEKLVEEFQLNKFLKTKSSKLSGGERRRVEIARSLSSNPKFILLDEPFAGVDPIAVEDIQKIISTLKQNGIGVLVTDHNVRETLSITDRAYLLYEGSILKSGTAKELTKDEEVRRLYLGSKFKMEFAES